MDETLTSPTCSLDLDSVQPLVSVVIPAHNAAADLDSCLASLAGQLPAGSEVIVVNDASTDATAEVARRHGARLFSRERRGGPASARNWGCHEARGTWIFFLDADVTVHPSTIATALAHLAANPGVDALFGSYDDAPGHPGLVSQFRNLLHHHVHQTGQFQQNTRPAQTFWTGCGWIRRSAFLGLGGFDHWLYEKPAIEDIEFGYRLHDAGHQTVLARDVLCKHNKHWTLKSMLRTDFFQRGLPWSLLMMRSTRPSSDLNVDRTQKSAALAAAAAWLGLMATAVSPVAGLLGCLAAIALMVGLNRQFFKLLYRKGGLWLATAGVGLMNLYYLVCLSSYATALGLFILQNRLGLFATGTKRQQSRSGDDLPRDTALMHGDLSSYLGMMDTCPR